MASIVVGIIVLGAVVMVLYDILWRRKHLHIMKGPPYFSYEAMEALRDAGIFVLDRKDLFDNLFDTNYGVTVEHIIEDDDG